MPVGVRAEQLRAEDFLFGATIFFYINNHVKRSAFRQCLARHLKKSGRVQGRQNDRERENGLSGHAKGPAVRLPVRRLFNALLLEGPHDRGG